MSKTAPHAQRMTYGRPPTTAGFPNAYNDACHPCGDCVCVPVMRHISSHLLEPVPGASATIDRVAAE